MRWIETDTGTNVDISAATAIGVYTANADRLIICDVSLDAVAGAGDYVMYITRQIGGSGSAYVVLPKTTMTAATGETAISGQSGFITVRNGDVLTCYVDGLAGDISTPDWTTRWFELAALKPATADRTIDVDADGKTLLQSGAITAAVIAQDAIDADSIKADAITEIQNGLATAAALDAVDNFLDTEIAAILEDTGTTLPAAIAAVGGGAGGTLKEYTVTDSVSGLPIADVHVWVSTDTAGANVIASGYTDVSGQVTFMLDAATYYIWRMKAGYNFTNPDTEVVA